MGKATDERIAAPMYTYDKNQLQSKLADYIGARVPADAWQWLQEKATLVTKDSKQFHIAFAAASRKLGKQAVVLTAEEQTGLQQIRKQLTVTGWAIDRLCRVWLLLQLNSEDEDNYVQTIERLFPAAEMNELVALYSALPLLAYPQRWRARCAEGIRNNIADVLEAIMCDNPYPSEQLDEAAWNQLVLKAIFTEKPLQKVIGLIERSNETLANSLTDYAHERWAAHRKVLPLLWQCVGRFINAHNFADIQRIALSTDAREREAAALACQQSTYAPAQELLKTNTLLQQLVNRGITWQEIAEKLQRNS
ncbi:MAG: hypothetical protein DI538_06385 [Azospira oryzae]|nr:MAG: hypothetical protein DI538_06385 [Azospira oryzae]